MLDKFKSLIRCWDPTSTVIFANLRDIQSAVWRLHLRTAAFYHCLADQIFCRSQSLWRRKRTCITPPPSRDWPRPRPTTVTVEGTVLHWCARAMFAAGMLLVMLQVSVAVGLAIGNADPSRASITQCAASQCCVGGLCDQCRLWDDGHLPLPMEVDKATCDTRKGPSGRRQEWMRWTACT
jgi:hypothetical protein